MPDMNAGQPQRQPQQPATTRELIPIHFRDCHHTVDRGDTMWREEFNDFHFNYILFDWLCYYNRGPEEMINGYMPGPDSTLLDPTSFTMSPVSYTHLPRAPYVPVYQDIRLSNP